MSHRRPKMIKRGGGAGMPQMRIPIPHQTVKHELPLEVQKEIKDFQIIWPAYIDATKTGAQGRLIAKDKAVKQPNLRDMVEALTQLGFKAIAEPYKRYPRDILEFGRVRVCIKIKGVPVNPDLPHKTAVMIKLAEVLKSQGSRSGGSATSLR